MRTRIVLCAAIVLCIAGAIQAQSDTTWVASKSGKWSEASDWAGSTLPSASIKAFFNGDSECIVDFAEAEAWQIDLAGGPLKIVDGGVLKTHDWFILGYQGGDVDDNAGVLEVYDGGVLDSMVRLYVGYRGEGYLRIYEGGTVNVHSQIFGVGQQPGGSGFVELEGGTLNLLEGTGPESLHLDLETAEHSIDFLGGAMVLPDTTQNNDHINWAIGAGVIKAYGGIGEIVVDTDPILGRLTIRGVHPLKPFPSDDSLASVGDVELSWTLPDPFVPGQAVSVDVYFTDDLQALTQFTDPDAMRIVSNQSVSSAVVQTQPKTRYYWAIDSYTGSDNDPVYGPIFSFFADNPVPIVDAGADLVTWLEDGSRTKLVDVTVTDNGAYTAQWTVVSEPTNAVIDIQIANGNDDAEQHVDDGRMDIGSSDLELANEDEGDPATDEQVIGLRFVDVPMENGSLVANAYVEVEVDKVDKQGSGAPVNLIIEGELAPDAAPFENVANNITDRAVTTAQVKWSIPAWTERDAKFQTPDISSIIMEINSQRNWAPGNAIVLILRDDKDNPSTGLREAESYNGEDVAAPLLHIDLAGGPVVIETPTADDTNVTLSRLGEYVLQLEAFDGEYTGSDTVAINVYRDGCEAAKSLPDYVTPIGDLNGDCKVDEADLVLLEENWLQDHSLTEP